MTIQELREKRAKAWDTARDFLDTKRTASGLLSEEDSKTYDAMEQQIVAYGKEIQRLERQEQLDAELNRPTSQAILQTPTAPNLPKQTSGRLLMPTKPLSGTASATGITPTSGTICRLERILRAAILFQMSLNDS